ncbi:hypothetical protein GDO81_000111 [Engystomops pustulosus]|uniref:Major facilitator superfamily (MFS) profile domain-containing protein n=1 Tax=Engystomops pustulosus TaxID=76066 RepID=A0AAV7D1I7_ENGPU|nr:hypothetical protein GDO81_000111 [Engystomops pustulosus]
MAGSRRRQGGRSALYSTGRLQEDKGYRCLSSAEAKRMSGDQQEPKQGSNRVITVVFLALLIDLLGFTLILPLLPSILDHYSKSHDGLYQTLQHSVDWFAGMVGVPQERKYNSVLFGGLIGSLFSLLQFLCSPLTGAASDYAGRRRVLMITTAMIGVAFSLGFTIGPMVGAYFAVHTTGGELFFVRSALLALLLALLDLVFIFLFLPETLPKENRVKSMMVGFQGASDLLSPLSLFQFSAVTRRKESPSQESLHNLRVLGLVYFLYLFLFSGLEYTISFLTHQRFQFSSMQQGKMFFFIGMTMAVIQGGYARRIKPGNEVKAVKRAILLLIPAFLLIGWASGLTMLGAGLLLYSFAAAIVVPCLSSLVSTYGSASQKGTVMGILRSLGALARAVGPILSATLYWLIGAEACFTLCAVSFLIPLLYLRRVKVMGKEE